MNKRKNFTFKNKNVLWGIAPISPIHFGLDSLFCKIKNIAQEAKKITIVIADVHLVLTHNLSFNEAKLRGKYYREYIKSFCSNTQFMLGSDFQLNSDYWIEFLKGGKDLSLSKLRDTLSPENKRKATLAPFICSIMQKLDIKVFTPDLVIADTGQRKVYKLDCSANKKNNELKIKYIQNGCDILGRPLSQSKTQTRISIHDTDLNIDKKIRKMYAPPANQACLTTKQNALLEYFKYSVFPWKNGPITISNYDIHTFLNFKALYSKGKIHPNDCKIVLAQFLKNRIKRQHISNKLTSWIDVTKLK